MNNLNNNYHLIRLYFPSKDKSGLPLESLLSTKIYKSIIQDITGITGGLTVYPVNGYYQNNQGILINEDISLITVYTDKLSLIHELMEYHALIILDTLNQESVLIDIDNNPEFITGKERINNG